MEIMIDLETMGTDPTSPIIAIGAVAFEKGQILDSFYVNVILESSMSLGARPSADTIMWWMKQSDAARAALMKGGVSLPEALSQFTNWLNNARMKYTDPEPGIWGNGASFDNVLLSEAYRMAGHARPWKFWQDRCYRTIKALYPSVPFIREGTHHDALDDARSQAKHLMTIAKIAGMQI